jgi:hypothetical protein
MKHWLHLRWVLVVQLHPIVCLQVACAKFPTLTHHPSLIIASCKHPIPNLDSPSSHRTHLLQAPNSQLQLKARYHGAWS